MTKIIFLDIDGVLNNKHNPPFPVGWPDRHLSEHLVERVNRIAMQTGAHIVMSTSWRVKFSIDEFTKLLGKKGLTAKIIDATPCKFSFHARGYEISDWLENAVEDGLTVDNYVILDDTGIDNHPGHFVQTDPDEGITEADVEKAINILSMMTCSNVQ